jgi:hypothetical protein
MMTAKERAIAADEAALQTLIAKLLVEQKKTQARISVLTAEVSGEDVNYQMVGVEISEKQIQLAETELKILNVGTEIARIQLQIAEAASELVEVDLRKAELKNRIVNAEIDAVRAGFTANDVIIAASETDLEEGATKVAEQESISADAKELNLEENVVPMYQEIGPIIDESIENKRTAQVQIDKNELTKMQNAVDMNALKNDEREANVGLEGIGLTADNAVRDNQTLTADNVNNAQQSAEWSMAYAAIHAAEMMAKAEITTKLTHIIGKAE